MAKLTRFGVSIDNSVLKRFDKYIEEKGYKTRSKAISDLISSALLGSVSKGNKIVAGAITIVFDHHKRGLGSKITNIQHHYHDTIISTQHVHLDHDNCLEIIIVKDHAKRINSLVDELKAVKGVQNTSLVIASS